jgi:hypothetical protein
MEMWGGAGFSVKGFENLKFCPRPVEFWMWWLKIWHAISNRGDRRKHWGIVALWTGCFALRGP